MAGKWNPHPDLPVRPFMGGFIGGFYSLGTKLDRGKAERDLKRFLLTSVEEYERAADYITKHVDAEVEYELLSAGVDAKRVEQILARRT